MLGPQDCSLLLFSFSNGETRPKEVPSFAPVPQSQNVNPQRPYTRPLGNTNWLGVKAPGGWGGESAALWELELEEEEKEEQGSSASVVAQCVGSPRATEVLLGQSVIGAGHGREGPEMVDFLQVELGHSWQREEL